jgi:hypothetical protein
MSDQHPPWEQQGQPQWGPPPQQWQPPGGPQQPQ